MAFACHSFIIYLIEIILLFLSFLFCFLVSRILHVHDPPHFSVRFVSTGQQHLMLVQSMYYWIIDALQFLKIWTWDFKLAWVNPGWFKLLWKLANRLKEFRKVTCITKSVNGNTLYVPNIIIKLHLILCSLFNFCIHIIGEKCLQ